MQSLIANFLEIQPVLKDSLEEIFKVTETPEKILFALFLR